MIHTFFVPNLGRVSTTRGSGWVRSLDESVTTWLRTHPLPRVVLTRPKQMSHNSALLLQDFACLHGPENQVELVEIYTHVASETNQLLLNFEILPSGGRWFG